MRRDVYLRMRELEERHWWFVARRRIVRAFIGRYVSLPPGAAILDAGCGTGGNLPMLARLGTVIGLEPDATALALARSRPGAVEVRAGGLPDDLPFDPESFDLIVLLDVLEHVEDDRASLLNLARVLKPGGHLVMTVPAFPFLWSGHDDAHQHRRRYRRRGLVDKLTAAGLRPRCVTYYNSLLFPLIAAMRLLKRAGQPGDDLWMPSRIVNSVLGAVLGVERIAVGRLPLPAGVSLIACARKPFPD